jgi:hypothetical protein
VLVYHQRFRLSRVKQLSENLSADTNLAERAIRKVSGGLRSTAGTKARRALASLFHTWQARGLNPFDQCLALLSQPLAPPPKVVYPIVNSYGRPTT